MNIYIKPLCRTCQYSGRLQYGDSHQNTQKEENCRYIYSFQDFRDTTLMCLVYHFTIIHNLGKNPQNT